MGKYDWKNSPKWLNFLTALDQVGNVLFSWAPWPISYPGAGNPDRTVSYSLGKLEAHHGGKIPWRYPVAKGLTWILNKIDPGHCNEAWKNNT